SRPQRFLPLFRCPRRSHQDRADLHQCDGCTTDSGRMRAVSFWRKEVIDFALDQETLRHIEEQRAEILRAPANPRPYHNLAQLYRMQSRQDEALGLLLEAVRLDVNYADAHVALAEIYAVRDDSGAAWRHARAAEKLGNRSAAELLTRHHVEEPREAGSDHNLP